MERTRSLDIRIMLSVAWEIVLLGSPISGIQYTAFIVLYPIGVFPGENSFSSLPFSYYDFLKVSFKIVGASLTGISIDPKSMTVVEVYVGGSKISPPTEKVGMNG
ncbi:AP-5 complex subunit mu [Trifolium repens]|nr:AP-5 complex subunit mu [Trifolium repens]KAK2391868.1 AP-5 complex subunit mu [Trifolium repens]